MTFSLKQWASQKLKSWSDGFYGSASESAHSSTKQPDTKTKSELPMQRTPLPFINPMVLDVSHHNEIGSDGFERMYKFGIRGIIHKSTQGSNYTDPDYVKRREAALKAGMLWGAYHFADNSDPEAQVRKFLNVTKPDDRTLLALDFEPNGYRTMSLEGARAFLHAVELATGRKAVIYSGNLIKERLTRPDAFFNAHRLWLAQYSDHPHMPQGWQNAWLWQFSGDGVNAHGIRIPGIFGQVDINSYSGSAERLTSEWPSLDVKVSSGDSESDRIAQLQNQLAKDGFDPGPADGTLGPRTVKAFQLSHHLIADGIVGEETRPLLAQAMKG